MLNIVLFLTFIFFIVVSIKLYRQLGEERAIFAEFGQPLALRGTSLLFPLAPLILIFLKMYAGWLPAIFLGYVCYVPSLVLSRESIRAFEHSGTGRTRKALAASQKAFGTALVGIVYVSVLFLIYFASSQI